MATDFIFYGGKRLKYRQDIFDIDEAQALIDFNRGRGIEAACIWVGDVCHFYSEALEV